jgi:uncharacterized repeat protein (TIGR03803 family)
MRKLKAGRIIGIIVIVCAAATVSAPAQTFNTLYDFCSQPNCADGSTPIAGLAQGTEGALYGTAGDYATGDGTIFRISADGHYNALYEFCSLPNCADGIGASALILGKDGDFFGGAGNGGSYTNCSNGCGTLFKITSEGAFTLLYTFCANQSTCPDGAVPIGTLVQATDGNFYGVTEIGGTGNATQCMGCGTVFRMTQAGKLTTLYSFCSLPNCADGMEPLGLIQGANGKLYGITREGGNVNDDYCYSLGCGTVFEISLSGQLTTLYNFCAQQYCADGYFPDGPPMQGTDGNLYGTTSSGGNEENAGTAFQISTSGAFKILYTFCSQQDCDDGSLPGPGLTQGTDGNLYGATVNGGANNRGTAFQLTTSGALKTLYSFCSQPNCADGSEPEGGLIQATNGSFYGTTVWGGQSVEVCLSGLPGCGTVFSVYMGLRPFVETNPTSGNAGSEVLILGNNLTGATSVTFNGAAAAFTVASDTLIEATVPTGATSGYVRVTLPKQELKSNIAFVVTQ